MNKSIFYLILILFTFTACSKGNPFSPDNDKTVTNTQYIWVRTTNAITNATTNYVYVPPTITNVVIYTNTTDRSSETWLTITSNMYDGATLRFVNLASRPERQSEVLQWSGSTWSWLPYIPGIDVFCDTNIVLITDPAKERLGKTVKTVIRWTETNYIIVTNN